MKALVTGGAGFIGSHIVDALIDRGAGVRILDNLESRVHPQGLPRYISENAEFVKGDVRDRAALEYALGGIDVVFHCAAQQDEPSAYAKMFHSNTVGTALLFEVAQQKKLPLKKVVIASALAVYGEGQYCCSTHGLILPGARAAEKLDRGDWDLLCPECQGALVPVLLRESHANPATPFGVSKLAQESAALLIGKWLGIPTVVLRYSNVQGARQSTSRVSGICWMFAQALRHGQAPLVFEDGLQLRDYVHVADAVEANMLVLEHSGANGEIFNVGSGRATSVLDYARRLAYRMGSENEAAAPGVYRVGDCRRAISSISKLEALGWKSTRGLNEIFDDSLRWFDAADDGSHHLPSAIDTMQKFGLIRSVVCVKRSAAHV